jgi:hypothetical protein
MFSSSRQFVFYRVLGNIIKTDESHESPRSSRVSDQFEDKSEEPSMSIEKAKQSANNPGTDRFQL